MHPDLFNQTRLEFAATAQQEQPSADPIDAVPPALLGQSRPVLKLLLLLLLLVTLWVALLLWLMSMPQLSGRMSANAQDELVLQSAGAPPLQAYIGKRVTMIRSDGGVLETPNDLLSRHSARWLTSDTERDKLLSQHERLTRIINDGAVTLQFADGSSANIDVTRLTLAALDSGFWLRAIMATTLALTALVWLLAAAPQVHKSLALLTLCQSVLVALDALGQGLGTPAPPMYLTVDLVLRNFAELTMFGAILQASSVHMTGLLRRIPLLTWLSIGTLALLLSLRVLPHAWWWTQGGVQVALVAALFTQYRSQRLQPHPWTALFSHFTFPAMLIWPLITLAGANSIEIASDAQALRDMAPQLWSNALSVLFLALPFMVHSQRMAREIVLWSALTLGSLAGVLLWTALRTPMPLSVVWLDLLGILVLGIVARWWLSHHVFERRTLRAAQLFDALYRAIRMVDTHPKQVQAALSALLSSIFAPLKVEPLERQLSHSVILADGACLLVPIPNLHAAASGSTLHNTSLMLRGSHSGRRLFTQEDAHLADLIVEQIHRAVLFDKAVEHGRNDERLRLAQDLHDDIGARLLTLMYKSPTPEMEDYLRHTLKDLKTLTRGLSATNHSLSFACAEWKTDMAQRLAAADCELQWSASWDQDFELSIVHWSAVTRILRELVSNAIAHARATIVRIELNLESEQLMLRVQDNGNGPPPDRWSHGLGLSGVRKRVKQIGGSVEWKSLQDVGVRCEIKLTLNKPSEPSWT